LGGMFYSSPREGGGGEVFGSIKKVIKRREFCNIQL